MASVSKSNQNFGKKKASGSFPQWSPVTAACGSEDCEKNGKNDLKPPPPVVLCKKIFLPKTNNNGNNHKNGASANEPGKGDKKVEENGSLKMNKNKEASPPNANRQKKVETGPSSLKVETKNFTQKKEPGILPIPEKTTVLLIPEINTDDYVPSPTKEGEEHRPSILKNGEVTDSKRDKDHLQSVSKTEDDCAILSKDSESEDHDFLMISGPIDENESDELQMETSIESLSESKQEKPHQWTWNELQLVAFEKSREDGFIGSYADWESRFAIQEYQEKPFY